MIGIISDIKALFDLRGGMPPAMDYFFHPPHIQVVPGVAMKKAYLDQRYFLSRVGIRNLSRRSIKGVRVKLPFAPLHAPVVEGSADVKEDYEYDPSRAQVTLALLDPDSWLSVECFLVDDETQRFEEPKVLLEDRVMSRVSREMSLIRPYTKLYFLAISIFLASLGMGVYFIVKSSNLNPRVRAIQEAYDPSAGCHLNAYSKAEVTPEILRRHQLGEAFLLSRNKVATHEELLRKDYIVICE